VKNPQEERTVIKEAIDRIIQLATPNVVKQGKLDYTDKGLTLIVPPQAPGVAVTTLQGLVDLVDNKLDDLDTKKTDVIAHIKSSTFVEVISRVGDEYGRRRGFVFCTYPSNLVRPFAFGQWMLPEDFIIGCQTSFQRVMLEKDDGKLAADLDYVLKIASAISGEAITTSNDDGVSQKIAVKSGVVMLTSEKLKPRVMLAPYRTFAEIDQQLTLFVLRARVNNSVPQLALFEADGGRWHLSAIEAITEWLSARLGEVPIIS
jgi:hypothetical protein